MSIFDKILSFFTFKSDPKTLELKKLSKEILNESPKYFNPKKNIFYKNFGKDLYYLYKIIKPLETPLSLIFSNNKTKIITMKLFLQKLVNKQIIIYLNLLEDSNIDKIVEKYGIQKTIKYYQKIESELNKNLTGEINSQINSIFNFIKDIYELTQFNWANIISKFYPNFLNKTSKNSNQLFLDVKVTTNLIDFLEDLAFLLKNFLFKPEYIKFLQIYLIKYYKTKNKKFNLSEFKNNFKMLNKLININISPLKLEKYLKVLKNDPEYKISIVNNPPLNILLNHLSQKLTLAKAKLNNILIDNKKKNVKKLVDSLFEGNELLKSTYYNQEVSSKIQIVELPKLKYVYPYSITKSFVILYYEAKFKNILSSMIFKAEIVDPELSESLNNSLHSCNELLFKINSFEENLNFIEKLFNIIMKNSEVLKRSKHLKSNYIKELMNINEKAYETIVQIYNTLKLLYNTLTIIYNDIKTNNNSRIRNIINGFDKLYYNNVSFFHEKLKIYLEIIETLLEVKS